MPEISDRKPFFLLGAVLALLFLFSELLLNTLYPDFVHPPAPKGWAIIPEASWVEYHPALGWFHQKNKQAVLRKNGKEIPLSTNSLGLRGTREYAKQKPQDKIRIYAAGDSFTFGFGVHNESVYPALMEKLNPSFEVMNLGVAGYGVDQISLLIEEFGFDYQPDIVFLAIYPEDFWRSLRAFNDAGYGKPYFKLEANGQLRLMHVPVPKDKNFQVPQFPVYRQTSFMERIFSWSRLYRLLDRAVIVLKKKAKWEDPDTSPEWILGRAILQRAVLRIREHHTRPILIMVPPRRWLTGTTEPVRESLARFAKRENVEWIDLTPVFQNAIAQSSVDRHYIPDDFHWTEEGHALVARTLNEYLKTHRRLDAA